MSKSLAVIEAPPRSPRRMVCRARYRVTSSRRTGAAASSMRSLMRASRREYSRWNSGRAPIAAGAAAHLVELDGAEGHVVQHHMADVRQVDALAKRRRRDYARKVAGAKRALHGSAVGAGEAGVVIRDPRPELGHAPAKSTAQRDGLLARVDVDHAFLTARNDGDQAVLSAAEVALVFELEVLAHRGIDDDLLDAGEPADLGRGLG